MHLLIPHASALDDAARHALGGLTLPNLAALLARLSPTERWGSDEFSPEPPHDLALAALHCQAEPSTAAWAAGDTSRAWARLTPVHLAVASDGVDLLPPAALNLGESDAARFAALLREVWPEAEGWQWRLQAADCWLVGHASALDGLNAASIERAAGRPIEPWLPPARTLRRWQNEAQMLLHGHPLNAERETRGEHPVNSVWISGIGRASGSATEVTVDARLTAPLLAGDLAGWAEAWQRLDAGPLAALRADPTARLTLAGERFAQAFELRPLPLLTRLKRRWQALEPHTVLEAL